MKTFLIITSLTICLIQITFGRPQQLQRTLTGIGQQQIVQPKVERFTAAVINSEIAAITGFIGLFQDIMTNFWSTLPRFVNLIANPVPVGAPPAIDASNIPNVPNLPNLSGIGVLKTSAIPSQIETFIPENIIPTSELDLCQLENLS